MVRVGRPIKVRPDGKHENTDVYVHFYKLFLHLVKSLKKAYATIDKYVDKKHHEFPEDEIDEYLELAKRITRTEKNLSKQVSIYKPIQHMESPFLSVGRYIRSTYKRFKKIRRIYNKKGHSGVEKLWLEKQLRIRKSLFSVALKKQTFKKNIRKNLKNIIYCKDIFEGIYKDLKS